MSISLKVFNDFVQNSILDACVTTFKNITKANMYLTVTSGKDINRKLRTVVDIEKVFNGIYGNIVIRSVMENLAKSIDFELKFPFAPVGDFSIFFSTKTYFP